MRSIPCNRVTITNPLMDMMALRDPVRVIKGGKVLK